MLTLSLVLPVSVEPLTTEVHGLSQSFAGPPSSQYLGRPLYPGYGQYTAYDSAVSVASALGNITVPKAEPIGFTTVNANSNIPGALTQ